MIVGLRVVRGPDWSHDDQDGGRDHVGTVTGVKGHDEVTVKWDMGFANTYTVGENTKHDIRIFDNAPLGKSHPKVGCSACEEINITGTRWKCDECDNVNLCTPCYYDDSHVTSHAFLRIDLPGSKHVKVAKRSISQRVRALGIYPNAQVTRGPDWQYDNKDGGNGNIGKVEDVVSFGQDMSLRNAVRVRWPNGETTTCRLGYQGKCDVTCREEAPGSDFYIDHLANLDIPKLTREASKIEVLTTGDRVCVEMSKADLRQLQQGRRQWNTRMEELIGEIGIVKGFTNEGDIRVEYDDDEVILVKGAVKEVPTHKKGNTVRAIKSKETMQRLQKEHGGWDDGMIEILGKPGKVVTVDKDGDIAVVFEDQVFVFHPSCMIPAPGENVPGFPDIEEQDDDDDDDDDDDEESLDISSDSDDEEIEQEEDNEGDENEESEEPNIMQLFAGLLLLGALAEEDNSAQNFMNAVVQGNEAEVNRILQQNPQLISARHNNLPCITIAAHQGHLGVVVALLQHGADINVKDDKGNTALLVALMADKGDVARMLILRGALLNMCNIHQRYPIHVAAQKNMTGIVKTILDRGCDPNVQDNVGDTPLHDAISERHDSTALVLIEHPQLDVLVKNNKQFNTLAFACLKGHAVSVDKLLSRNPDLVNCTASEGFFPLHIAAINNHINEANILLVKGRADVNARNSTKLTPLHLAATEGYFEMVKLLLTYDADFSAQDSVGNTPIHTCLMGRRANALFLQLLGLRNLAEDNERIKIANFLIQHGAGLDVANNEGVTPLTCCSNERMREAVKTYAANNKPTKPERRQERPKTARVEQDMFTKAKQKCNKCLDKLADTRFLPCNHQVSCTKCCYKYKHCPVCKKKINQRVDKDNKKINQDGCVIS